MLVLVPHPKLLRILPNRIVWCIWGFLVRVFVIGWYKLRYGLWYDGLNRIPPPRDLIPVMRYLEICAQFRIRGAEKELKRMEELDVCVQKFLAFLEEKVSPHQLEGHHVRTIGQGSITRGHESFQIRLRNIRYRYWSVVILPGLTAMVQRLNCPMFYDVKPEILNYKDTTMMTEMNIHVWFNKKPFKVVQHRRYR